MTSVRSQKVLLEEALPGQPGLVELILMRTSGYQPLSLEEKIEEYQVAPSKINDSDVQPIAQ